MNNTEIQVQDLMCITQGTFEQALYLAYRDGIKSAAPLGYSGDTIILFNGGCSPNCGRVSQVSVSNHSGDVKLLITDPAGRFLFYGGYAIDLGVEFVAQEYWQVFQKLRSAIETRLARSNSFQFADISPQATAMEGFAMLKAYQELMVSNGISATDKPA